MTHKQTQIVCNPKNNKVQQAFGPFTLAKNIYKKYENTGMWSERPLGQPQLIETDVTNIPDFQEFHNIQTQANNAFNALGQNIVQRFKNPNALINFLEKEENRFEAEKLGLVNKTMPPQNLGNPTLGGDAQVPPVVPTGEK